MEGCNEDNLICQKCARIMTLHGSNRIYTTIHKGRIYDETTTDLIVNTDYDTIIVIFLRIWKDDY